MALKFEWDEEKAGVITMTTLTIKAHQKPTKETLERLEKLKDEDIAYDDDCPEMTPKMQKALAGAAAQRKQLQKVQ